MDKVPDEEHDRWVARLRELARSDAAELVPDPAFEVFGVADPGLQPVALADCQRADGQWESIGLAYGDWTAPGGPFVSVTTSTLVAEEPRGHDAGLLRLIDGERNRIAEYAGIDEADPAEPPDYSEASLAVGGQPVTVRRGRHGALQAAQFSVGRLSVIVVSRGIDLESLRLAVVADLRPYLEGRNEVLGRLSDLHRHLRSPVLAPAEGVAAYRALVDVELDQLARQESALRAGHEPRHLAGEGRVRHSLWQRAVAEQERLSGIGRRQADDIVTLVVNHMIHLQEKAAWFATERELREAAITETLRHAVLGDHVPSRSAQQAWDRYWAHHLSLSGIEPEASLFEALQQGSGLLAEWLAAWAAWAASDQ